MAQSQAGNGGVEKTRRDEDRPDPEVPEKPRRRQYSGEYKLRILAAADACSAPGEVNALLRREGLYSSLLSNWRKQRDRGALSGLEPKKRGPKSKEPNPLAGRLAELERENRKLRERLAQAEAIIEVQKKCRRSSGCRWRKRPERSADGSRDKSR